MAKVGFIGLGSMGRPMAHNLLRAGHELVFYARRNEPRFFWRRFRGCGENLSGGGCGEMGGADRFVVGQDC